MEIVYIIFLISIFRNPTYQEDRKLRKIRPSLVLETGESDRSHNRPIIGFAALVLSVAGNQLGWVLDLCRGFARTLI